MRVGFAGLGRMGAHMARYLSLAGHGLTLWNRSIRKAQSLAAELDCAVADSPLALSNVRELYLQSFAPVAIRMNGRFSSRATVKKFTLLQQFSRCMRVQRKNQIHSLGLSAAIRSVAACSHNWRTIHDKDGIKPTSSGLSRCCGCNPHCRHSLQLQNAVIGKLTECGRNVNSLQLHQWQVW